MSTLSSCKYYGEYRIQQTNDLEKTNLLFLLGLPLLDRTNYQIYVLWSLKFYIRFDIEMYLGKRK